MAPTFSRARPRPPQRLGRGFPNWKRPSMIQPKSPPSLGQRAGRGRLIASPGTAASYGRIYPNGDTANSAVIVSFDRDIEFVNH